MKMTEGTAGRVPLTTIGILYRDRSDAAIALSEALTERLRTSGRRVWSAALPKGEVEDGSRLAGTEVVLVLGGDGSILTAARMCAPLAIPILGINFGRVGFLTELEPSEVDEKLPLYLGGDYWVDERAMLQAEVGMGSARQRFIALNDVVMVRGAEPRVIRIKVWLDGHYYNTTVADGVIVSTATGSTAYNLAAGGPILHPQVRSSVLTPIAPHLAADRSLILEPHATISLELQPDSDGAILSADGQINHEVSPGAQVTITGNTHLTRFLRRRPPTHFYRILAAKLRDTL
ncbi:MAG: NAD(+)/NADH kinase [Ktedonobacterales bacterium]|nr:NAD(+)/NADH kinase [Ktedonobacterales bacterium]